MSVQVVPPENNVVVPVVEDDPFAAAFAEFSVDKVPVALDPAPKTDAEKAEEREAELASEIVVPKEGDEKPETTQAAPATTTEAPKVPAAPAAPGLTADELAAAFAKAIRQPEPVQDQRQPQQQAPLYSQEEAALLNTVEKDWPDIARAIAVRERALVAQLVPYIFSELGKTLSPIMEVASTLGERQQLTDLRTVVPDYDTVRDNVITWVEQQPAYLQTAYKHVIAEGTVDQVHDLIERYRKDVGAAATPAPQVKSPTKDVELSPVAKQAAARLAPVPSKRSVVGSALPEDFDSAFAAFAASENS